MDSVNDNNDKTCIAQKDHFSFQVSFFGQNSSVFQLSYRPDMAKLRPAALRRIFAPLCHLLDALFCNLDRTTEEKHLKFTLTYNYNFLLKFGPWAKKVPVNSIGIHLKIEWNVFAEQRPLILNP